MATTIKPIGDHVLVERVEDGHAEQGGIFIPDNAREKPQRATVLAVGPGKRDDAGKRTTMEVRAGDTVLIGKYCGTDIEQGGRKYTLLSAADILAVFV